MVRVEGILRLGMLNLGDGGLVPIWVNPAALRSNDININSLYLGSSKASGISWIGYTIANPDNVVSPPYW